MRYFLGIDLGSSELKITLLGEDGHILGPFSRELESVFPAPGWVEQDPNQWYEKFLLLFRESLSKCGLSPADISGIAIDAATHTTVLLDENWQPLQNAILWNDQRSAGEAEAFQREHGEEIYRLTYHSPSSMWSLCQLKWVRDHAPRIWEKTRHLLFAKDYLRLCLGGENVTDYIDAQGSMLLNMESLAWDERLCGLIGVGPEMLPALRDPLDLAGRVHSRCARETGMAPGTPIYTGTSDTAMEILAAGAVRVGDATMKLATSGRICLVTQRAYPHQVLVNYSHVVKGLWYPGSGTRSCATSLRWFKDNFCKWEATQASEKGSSVYPLLDRMAGEVPAGSQGLIYHPYLLGEFTPYQDPRLRASFFGASMGHTHAHFVRAIMEGCVFSLMDCYRTLLELQLPAPKGFRLIGGGASGNTWSQIVADVFQMPVKKPAISDSSFGSAMLAAVGGGIYQDFQQAAGALCGSGAELIPEEKNGRLYREMFELYKDIQKNLAPLYARLEQTGAAAAGR